MTRKISSLFVCAMVVVSVSASIAQNVGEPNSSSSGTSGLADSPWPMFRQNLNHTGLSPYDTSGNPGKLKWSFTTGYTIRGPSPAIDSDGIIYIGCCDMKLYAIKPDGIEKWSFTTGNHVHSSPAIGSDGTIYFGSDDGKLYAINPDGTEKWSYTIGQEVDSSPAIGSDGTIYVGSHDHKLYAINSDGTKKWSFQTGAGIIYCSPTISSDGTVYIGSFDNKLYAINPNGTEKWNFVTGNYVWSSPAIGSDGTVYVGSFDHKLYAINLDGFEKWNFTTGSTVRSSPAIDSNGIIYVGSYDDKLYAINPDGTEKWSFNTGNDIISSPSIGSDGTIYVGSKDNKLYAINSNGNERWSFMAGGYIHSSPAIGSDGTIYFGSNDHKLYAIGTPRTPPIANAGPDQTVNEGDVVQFFGCNSTGSADGDPPYVNPDVVALWHMDEGSGSIIYDETAYNNDGTVNGATWTSGKFGTALKFGDTDLVYEIPASFDDPITTDITVVAWVYWEGPHPWTYSSNSYIIDARDLEGTQGGFILYLNYDGTLVFLLPYGYGIGNYQIVQSTCKVPINRWTHVAGVLDYTNGELKLYINGNEDTSVPATEPYHDFGGSHWDAAIGNNRYAPGDNKWAPFNGIIDEVVICNRALTAQKLPGVPAEILSYEWDFDADTDSDSDGNFTNDVDATGPTPTHVYGDDGVYNVTLTVRTSVEGGSTKKIDQDAVFCVDISGSMTWDDVQLAKEGLNNYVDEMESPDQGAVVVFGYSMAPEVRLLNPLTDDYDQLRDDIASIPGPESMTPMGDAINISIDELLLNGDPRHTQVIILLTDGIQTSGTHDPIVEAYNAASHNITIFTIGLGPFVDEPTLKKVANITGGTYCYAPDSSYLITIYREISQLVEYPYGEMLSDTDTMLVTVNNVAPTINPVIPSSGNEGSAITFTSTATDPGSDDLIFTWDWGDGTAPTITTYYNDGVNPEPIYDPSTNEIKSPEGAYPFNVTDTIQHTYGDDGTYSITLLVEDDDGGVSFINTTVVVNNVAPTITLVVAPSGEEGDTLTFEAEATDPGSDDLTFEWEFEYGPTIINTYYNDGVGPEPIYDPISNEVKSPCGMYPFNASDMVIHTYGDNYNYSLTLRIRDDDDGMTTYTTSVAVDNIAPSIVNIVFPSDVDEGSPAIFQATASDQGSDDLTFAWELELGPTITNTYYNDGLGLDPYPSPWGNYPFNATDMVSHIYGDNGEYFVLLTITDDDGGTTTYNTTLTVNNVAPIVDALPNATIDEGGTVSFSGHATDPGSDDLAFTWDWGYAGFDDTINTYLNNPPNPDPYPSLDVNPRDEMDSVGQTFSDNGVFQITLTVTDDDGGATTVTTMLTVDNVAPTITNIEAYMFVNFTLRVAGEKWHSVDMTLYEDDTEIWDAKVTRQPGSPDEQAASLNDYKINLGSHYKAVVDYLPNDPRVNGNVWGGNPVWIIMEFQDGTSERLHHTFNVRKSYWDSDHWNHIDPWEVDLTGIIYGHNITFKATATDPGSDDLTFNWSFGTTTTYYNNGLNPDPCPSPDGLFPFSITDIATYPYSGPETIILTVIDDDGGTTTVSIDLA